MITVQLEYDDVEKPDIDENWVRSVCKNIFMDSKENEASITIIFSNDYFIFIRYQLWIYL